MTQALYLQNTYLFEAEGKVLHAGQDEKGPYLVLSETIFYPQGGGQPSDQGKICWENIEIHVHQVRHAEGEIRHYVAEEIVVPPETLVSLKIDQERRILKARYHTAGHLLGNVVEMEFPHLKAIKGHSFPGEAYVDFQGAEPPELEKIQSSLQSAIHKNASTRLFEIDRASFEEKFYILPYPTPPHKAFRVMQIEGFLPIPCGGTHLASLGEIGEVKLSKIKSKGEVHHIKYEVD